MNKHSVTHPDGTTSSRNSQNRIYTHAVVVGPADPEAYATELERVAELGKGFGPEWCEEVLAKAATVRAKGEPVGKWTAIAWCGRADLADKQLKSNTGWCRKEGRTVQVVEVTLH